MIPERWVIWSELHGGWWCPNRMGYTPSLKYAGRYSWVEAIGIVKQGNGHEVMVPDPWPKKAKTCTF